MNENTMYLELPNNMPACPVAWINFFFEELDDGPREENQDVTMPYINSKLERWNARYVESPSNKHSKLVFASPEDLTLFLLRWS